VNSATEAMLEVLKASGQLCALGYVERSPIGGAHGTFDARYRQHGDRFADSRVVITDKPRKTRIHGDRVLCPANS
jgi:hypothetical protein